MKYYFGKNVLNFNIEGSGHPLLILHAMGTDHRAMKKWMESIFTAKQEFKRIYVDLPWHGYSNCRDIISTEGIRELLLSFLSALIGDQHFSMIGHSFGGYIAQGLISEKVSGLCLIAPAIHDKEHNPPEKVVLEMDESAISHLEPDIRVAFDTLMVYQSAANLHTFLEEIQPGRQLADRSFLASNWRESGYYFKENPLARPFKGPSLLIGGRFDSICGYMKYYPMAESLPDSKIAILDAGHLLPIEKRETVQLLVQTWLAKLKK